MDNIYNKTKSQDNPTKPKIQGGKDKPPTAIRPTWYKTNTCVGDSRGSKEGVGWVSKYETTK